MEYLAFPMGLPMGAAMEYGPGTRPEFSASTNNEAAFEQLLRLAASYPSQQSAATVATQSGRRAVRKNPIAEDIEVRAYHIYLQRGAAHGSDLDDWLQAERQVLEGLKRDKASLRVALAFGFLKDSLEK